MRSTSKYASLEPVGAGPVDGESERVRATRFDARIEARIEALVDDEVAACRLLAFRDDWSESEILQDCHRRVMTHGTVSWSEADRVVRAVAARVGWMAPAWPGSG